MLSRLFLVDFWHVFDSGSVHVDTVKSDNAAIGIDNDPDTDDISFATFFRGQLQVVVNLGNTT